MYAVLSCRQVVYAPPAHLQTCESKYKQKTQHSARSPARNPQMDIENIDQPRHQGPGLLRIPAPVMSPRLLRPKHSRKHAESKERRTYLYKGISCRQNILRTGYQTHHCKDECTTEQGIRKHVHGDMRNEPRALQRRHQRLVMDFGTSDIQDNENRRENGREGQNPSVPPFEISQQTCQ